MLNNAISIWSFFPLVVILIIIFLGIKLKGKVKWFFLTFIPMLSWLVFVLFMKKLENAGGLYYALFYTVYIFMLPVYYTTLAIIFYIQKKKNDKIKEN